MSGNPDEGEGVGADPQEASESDSGASNGADNEDGGASGDTDAPATRPKQAAPEEDPEEVIERLRGKLREQRERLLRSVADLENFKKRAARERDQYVQRAGESLARDLLPVLDNMDRALEHAETSIDERSLVDGVKLIHKLFIDTLAKHGIEPFESLGEKFDPVRHEALSQAVSADVEPGTVMQQFARGYTIRGHLLRPAMVIVAKAPAEASVEKEADADDGGTPAAWDSGEKSKDNGSE